MSSTERRGWKIVAVLYATIFFAFGSGYITQSVFFPPMLRELGWSRARLSSLATVLNLSIAVSSLLVGWLMDKVAAQYVIAAGVVIVAVSYLLTAMSHSYPVMVECYILMGLGLTASAMVPGSVVVANWIHTRRGTALTLIASALAIGGMSINLCLAPTIGHIGWREARVLLTIPLWLLVPLILWVVRTRPEGEEAPHGTAAELPPNRVGMDVLEALGTRTFWIIVFGEFVFGFAANGNNLHMVPMLIGIGYHPAEAAVAIAFFAGAGGVLKIVLGMIADRFSGRLVLACDLLIFGSFLSLMFVAQHWILLVVCIVVAGSTNGAPAGLFPMVLADSVGLKRYGTLGGIANAVTMVGGAVGMLMGGWLYDLFGSYRVTYESYIVLPILGGLTMFGVKTYREYAAERALRAAAVPSRAGAGGAAS